MQKSDTAPQVPEKKQDWADVEGEEDETHNQAQTASQSKAPQTQAKKAEKKKKKVVEPPKKTDPNLVSNIFVCNELDADDNEEEEEVAPKKEKVKETGPSMRDLIANKAPKEEKPLSKKDQKKKELEDLDKLLNEMGLANQKTEEAPKEQPKEETKAGEGENADKKKKKKKAEKTDAPQPTGTEEVKAPQTTTEAQSTETKPENPVDAEKRIQEVLKKKAAAAAAQKKQTTALEAAKQEILARSTNSKKPNKKKDYDL